MPRSQRHLVEQQGFASNGDQIAQGVISPDIQQAPAQFASDAWTVEDLATDGDIQISVTEMPSEGGADISDVEYQLDDGDWESGSLAAPGPITVSGLTNAQEYDVKIRAVNETGAGPASDTKQVTPTAA